MNFIGLIIFVLFCASSQIIADNTNDPNFRLFLKIGSLTENFDSFYIFKSFYMTRTLQMNWPKALMFCENYGMEMASVDSSLESLKLLELVNNGRKIFIIKSII